MGRVYAVASAKGGVGKTTTTANLGAALASTGASVAVVDADLGMPNLGAAFGVDAEPTVHDALAGEADATAVVHEAAGGVAVAPGSDAIDDFQTADPADLQGLVAALADAHDYVVVDGGAGLNHDSLVPLSVADEVVLVTGTGRDAHGDTAKTRTVADRLGTPVAGVVVSRVPAESSPDLTDVDGLADLPVLGVVRESPAVAAGTERGDPVVHSDPDDPASTAYLRIASELTGEESLRPDDAEDGGDDDAVETGDDDAVETGDDGGEADETGGAEAEADEDEADGDEADDGEPGDAESDGAVGGDFTGESDDTDEDGDTSTEDDAVDETGDETEDETGDETEDETDEAPVDDLVEEAEGGDAATDAPEVRETTLFSSEGSVVEEAEGGDSETDGDAGANPAKKGFLSRLFGLD
jgi:septum site-determining protein MinD